MSIQDNQRYATVKRSAPNNITHAAVHNVSLPKVPVEVESADVIWQRRTDDQPPDHDAISTPASPHKSSRKNQRDSGRTFQKLSPNNICYFSDRYLAKEGEAEEVKRPIPVRRQNTDPLVSTPRSRAPSYDYTDDSDDDSDDTVHSDTTPSHAPHVQQGGANQPSVSGSKRSDFGDFYPDGEWGWIVVVGAFMMDLLCKGIHLASGSFLLFLRDSHEPGLWNKLDWGKITGHSF